jgi:TATA-box binding protein (TBP) (component of TFIID and TFIIIB)
MSSKYEPLLFTTDENEEEQVNISRINARLEEEEEEEAEDFAYLFGKEKFDKSWTDEAYYNSDESFGSTEEEEEEEPDSIDPEEESHCIVECNRVKHFVKNLSSNTSISDYELSHLRTTSHSCTKTMDFKGDQIPEKDDRFPMSECEEEECVGTRVDFVANEKNFITDDDRERALYTIIHTATGAEARIMLENRVYVSYFFNFETGGPHELNLHDVGIKLLPFGVQYSKNKFTKVTIKYVGGPSHYIFRSGAMVESGTFSPAIARKKHNNTMDILQRYCGYRNLAIRDRKCQNIVAKGILPFGICLTMLRNKYPYCVQYDEEKFAGAIIRVKKLDLFLANQNKVVSSKKARSFSLDEEEEESTSSSSEEEEEESDHDDDSSSYSYEELIDEDKYYNQDFVLDKTRVVAAANNEQKPDLTPTEVLSNMSVKTTEVLEQKYLSPKKKKKITILVFEKGRIICAGCKSRNSIIKSYDKVLAILEPCRDSAVNKAIEAAERIKEKLSK